MTGKELYKINSQIWSTSGLDLFRIASIGSYLLASQEKILTDCVKKVRCRFLMLPSPLADTKNKYRVQSKPLTQPVLINQSPQNFQGIMSAIYYRVLLLRKFQKSMFPMRKATDWNHDVR